MKPTPYGNNYQQPANGQYTRGIDVQQANISGFFPMFFLQLIMTVIILQVWQYIIFISVFFTIAMKWKELLLRIFPDMHMTYASLIIHIIVS